MKKVYVINEYDEFGGVTTYPIVFANFQAALAEAYNTAEYKFYKSGSYTTLRQVLCVLEKDCVVVYRTDRRPYEVVRRFDIEEWTFVR